MRGVIHTADSLIIAPTLEPLDLEEVKKQRRFSPTTLDTLFDLWISAARQHVEEQTGRQLMTATWEYWLDAFPCHCEIELPHPPLQSVVSVKYDDGDGEEQTLDADSYRVLNPQGDLCQRGRIAIAAGASWPITATWAKAVRIRYVAGYGSAPGDVPELIRFALLQLVGHFHRFGEEVQEGTLAPLPMGAQMVIDARKYTALPTLLPRSTWD